MLKQKEMKTKIKVYEVKRNISSSIDGRLIAGSLEDIRIWAKNLWFLSPIMVKGVLGFNIEEDYYASLDVDSELFHNLKEMSFRVSEICEISIEDFDLPEELISELLEN